MTIFFFVFVMSYFLLSLFLIPTALSRESFWCPESCHCSISSKIIDCSFLRLKSVPLLPINTVRLYLSNNEIDKLQFKDFAGLHHLTYLILSNNKIHHLSDGIFTGLKSLKYLILDGNFLETLPGGLLRGLRQLSTLSLARNQLKRLPQGLLDRSRMLSLLNLQHNRLGNDMLLEVSSSQALMTLILDFNNLTSFSPPKQFPALRTLNLASNQIASISSPILPVCSSLISLDLSNNSIEDLSDRQFTSCNNLQKLYLQHNKLKELSIGGSVSTSQLYLHGNNISTFPMAVLQSMQNLSLLQLDPLPCNCSLLPLARWSHKNEIKGLRCFVQGEGVAKITILLNSCSKEGKGKKLESALQSPPNWCSSSSANGSLCSSHGGLGNDDFLSVLLQTTLLHKDQKDEKTRNKEKTRSTLRTKNYQLESEIKSLGATVATLKEELEQLTRKLSKLEYFVRNADLQSQSKCSSTGQCADSCQTSNEKGVND